ncbi:hypothetical protein WOLCODRAFT_103768 [Wolfiporia cocos MD-104 SS10]|uniref:Mediator complex subunit 1 n=1 Tax=Wolfiporia cocos (strain MD-104) TaxID=742152 RepID=A0A2H3JNU3_WOLCO|nr:hypothetical protein WOLCODRAFT_103768 [Wolfiporia cocos MD-104 SS10]
MAEGSSSASGYLDANLLSLVQRFLAQQATFTTHSTHPFASSPEAPLTLLRDVVETLSQVSHSLSLQLSLPLANPKLLSLYRQQTAISHTLHSSNQNISTTLDALRQRAGVEYGEDIPLERVAVVDWCVSRLESWGSSAGMETFREEEREGRLTVVLGGKVVVVDIDFAVDRTDPENPSISVASVKTSYAIPNSASGTTTQGSSSLDGLLAECISAFLAEAHKDPQQHNNVRAAQISKLVSEHLAYLMRLDHLALSENDTGLRWFNNIDVLTSVSERFAANEAQAVSSALSVTHSPLDIFLMRSHALPLPYLTAPSISFLTYLSPLAYLSTLRGSSSTSADARADLPKLDIPYETLRSRLAAHPRSSGATIATLMLSPTTLAISTDDAMDVSDLRTRPSFILAPSGTEIDHELPRVPTPSDLSGGPTPTWILDFTDGGRCRGVVMSQSRMREIELVVNPLSGMDHIGSMPMMAFGTGSWLDLLLNPDNPISPERYTAVYTSPMSAHPPLQLRLTAPEEPGFILEKVPVRSLKEIWGVLEVVKEQCWLNETLRGYHWLPEGLATGEPDDEMSDDESMERDLQAVLKGTLTPRRIPVNVYLPSMPPTDSLFDANDLASMALSHTPQSSHAKIFMSCPERPPIPGLVEITVAFDPSRPRGIVLDINGAMGADLRADILEEVCRRGGTLGLPGRVWAKSHGGA